MYTVLLTGAAPNYILVNITLVSIDFVMFSLLFPCHKNSILGVNQNGFSGLSNYLLVIKEITN